MKPFNIMTVPHLLSALLGVATISCGLVCFDAERLITAVDNLRELQAQDHLQVVVTQGDISGLKPRVSALEATAQNHEFRLLKLEPR